MVKFRDYLDSLIDDEILRLELSINELKYILDEAKQVGDIYHFTELRKLEPILRTGKLKISDKNTNSISFLSLTRNYKMPSTSTYFGADYSVRFTLDGDKISENIKILPFQDPNYTHKEESEEVVFNNLKTSKYVKHIDIILGKFDDKNKIENLCKKYNTKVNFVKKWIRK